MAVNFERRLSALRTEIGELMNLRTIDGDFDTASCLQNAIDELHAAGRANSAAILNPRRPSTNDGECRSRSSRDD